MENENLNQKRKEETCDQIIGISRAGNSEYKLVIFLEYLSLQSIILWYVLEPLIQQVLHLDLGAQI